MPFTSFVYGDPAVGVWGEVLPLGHTYPTGLVIVAGAQFSTLGDVLLGPPIWPAMTFCSNGVVGVSYSQQFDLAPASSPTTFSLLSGTIPPGLGLTSVSNDVGLLSGAPTTPGTYTFTLRATNSYGSADKSFTVTIVAGASGGGSWAALC